MNLNQYYPHLLASLIFGGITILGAAAGVRFSMGIITQSGCPMQIVGPLEPCQQALTTLNTHVKTLLAGGAIATGAGVIGLHSHQTTTSDTIKEARDG